MSAVQAEQYPVDTTIASAGTGKTYSLVGEIIAALEAGIEPHRIMATTFTKKAAAELAGRIRSRLIDAGKPSEAPVVFQARQPGLEYDVADGGDRFYVLNNGNARNFKVSVCPSSDTARSSWTDLVPHREDTLVEYIDVFENWLVLKERFWYSVHLIHNSHFLQELFDHSFREVKNPYVRPRRCSGIY